MTGCEEGLDKRHLASTYCSGDTVAENIFIFEKVKFALSLGVKKD